MDYIIRKYHNGFNMIDSELAPMSDAKECYKLAQEHAQKGDVQMAIRWAICAGYCSAKSNIGYSHMPEFQRVIEKYR